MHRRNDTRTQVCISRFHFIQHSVSDANLFSDAKNLNLRGTLKMLADPVTKMPALYQNIAEALYDTFQAENWGEPVIKRESPEKAGPSPAKRAKTVKDGPTGSFPYVQSNCGIQN